MAEGSGSKSRWLAVAVTAALLIFAIAVAAPGSAPAQKCNPECIPPPEEEGPPPESPPEKPTTGPKLLVVNLGWDTGNAATSAPLQQSTIDNAVNHLRNSVNPWFRTAAPGIFREWTVIRGGSYTIAPPKILFNGGCGILGTTVDSFWSSVRDAGDAAARAGGFDPNAYSSTIYVWSPKVCSFDGIKDTLSNRIGLPVVQSATHELGHLLGLEHARLLGCKDAGGTPAMPLTGTCNAEEYGDPYDTMGNTSDGLYNAVFQKGLGWMNNQVVDVSAGDFTQSWTLKPLSEIGQSPRALRLVDGPTTIWLEYRQPTGLDAPQVTGAQNLTYGVVVHREVDRGPGKVPGAHLLDMSPGTPASDPVLRVGQTWVNPLGAMNVTVNGTSATGATVTLSSRLLTVPDVRGLTPTRAQAVLEGAGFWATGWGSVVDPTCAFLGLVAAQTPSGGTRGLPGPVTVSIGERDPTRECL